MIEQIAVSKHQAALAVGRNVRTKDTGIHGLYITSLPDAQTVDYIATDAPCVGSGMPRLLKRRCSLMMGGLPENTN